jgi:hypothetical protein
MDIGWFSGKKRVVWPIRTRGITDVTGAAKRDDRMTVTRSTPDSRYPVREVVWRSTISFSGTRSTSFCFISACPELPETARTPAASFRKTRNRPASPQEAFGTSRSLPAPLQEVSGRPATLPHPCKRLSEVSGAFPHPCGMKAEENNSLMKASGLQTDSPCSQGQRRAPSPRTRQGHPHGCRDYSPAISEHRQDTPHSPEREFTLTRGGGGVIPCITAI